MTRRLPDAHVWEDSTYRVTSVDGPMAQVYHVETEIPTAGHDCWVMFDVAKPADGGVFDVLFFQAIRCGAGSDVDVTYVCEGLDGVWVLARD